MGAGGPNQLEVSMCMSSHVHARLHMHDHHTRQWCRAAPQVPLALPGPSCLALCKSHSLRPAPPRPARTS